MRHRHKVEINFIRHGKTELNEKHCYAGITDSPLSKNGRLGIIEKKNASIYTDSELVFVSPLKRCIETTSIIYPNEKQIVIDDFKEMDFGSFEGKCYEELKNNKYYRKWIDSSRGASVEELKEIYGDDCSDEFSNIDTVLPEDRDEFIKRVLRGFDKTLIKSKGKDKISIVAHGGTIMAIASTYEKSDYYKYMVSCGDGIETEVIYTEENGNIEVSHFSVIDWIRA